MPFSPWPTPAQAKPTSTDPSDPLGHIYKLQNYGCYYGVDASINAENAAAELCTQQKMCGVSVVNTVKFLTETSIKYKNGNGEATPTDPSPKKDSTTEGPPKPTQPNEAPSEGQAPRNKGSGQAVPPSPSSLSNGGPAVIIGSGSSKTAVSLTLNQAGETVAIYSGRDATATSTISGDIGGLIASGFGVTGTGDPAQFTGQAASAVGRNLIATIVAVFPMNMLFII